jgi:cation:H+ antiporter
MEIVTALVVFGVGLGLIIVFAEQLVKGVVGTSMGFGLSTYLLSVTFIGFDPDNLAVGTMASAEGVTGIALGSIVGSAMVAVAFAFGLSALVAPMTFAQVPPQILVVQMLAVVLLAALALDGQLSRVDGSILLVGFGLAILYLVRLGRRGLDITPSGEVGHRLQECASRIARPQDIMARFGSWLLTGSYSCPSRRASPQWHGTFGGGPLDAVG